MFSKYPALAWKEKKIKKKIPDFDLAGATHQASNTGPGVYLDVRLFRANGIGG